jgi:hypothetical protein
MKLMTNNQSLLKVTELAIKTKLIISIRAVTAPHQVAIGDLNAKLK